MALKVLAITSEEMGFDGFSNSYMIRRQAGRAFSMILGGEQTLQNWLHPLLINEVHFAHC